MSIWEKRVPELVEFAQQGWRIRHFAEFYKVSEGYMKFKLCCLDISLLKERREAGVDARKD